MDASENPFYRIREQVRAITGYTDVSPITGGFSFEQKYLLTGGDATPYLVRIIHTPHQNDLLKKQEEFRILSRLRQYSKLVPRTIAFGTTDDRSLCFMILTYCPGNDAEGILASLSDEEQFLLGVEAGRELKRLHGMPAPAMLPEWSCTISAKFKRKCCAFIDKGLDLPDMDLPKITAFVEKNLPGIRSTRQTFLHDDYHPGNLIIQNKKLSGIIDFNRYDWGDPIHDFVKLGYFSRAISIPFSAGQVDGYHGGSPRPEFWQRYSLYCAMTIVADVLWSALYEEKGGVSGEMNRALQRDCRVIADHEQFTSAVPGWYRNYQRPATVRSFGSGEKR